MARRKGAPGRSQLVRERAKAFARRVRTGTRPDEDDDEPAEDATPTNDASGAETQPVPKKPRSELPEITASEPRTEPWPDATPSPMKPVEARAHADTAVMAQVVVGKPPDMPKPAPPPPVVFGAVEAPTHMPGPREIPSGSPEDPAAPPGLVPPGDSRSLRRGGEFALVYRVGTCVISRTGTVGLRGQWRVVEYPTSAAASNSYAKECSRFVSEGFSDYRDRGG